MTDPCHHEGRLATLENQDRVHTETLMRIEAKQDIILAQISKVAVLEVNHDNQRASVDRAFAEISKLQTTTSTHNKFMWVAIGVGLAVSVGWTIFGVSISNSIAENVKAVAEMRAHIAQDKVMSGDDGRKARQ